MRGRWALNMPMIHSKVRFVGPLAGALWLVPCVASVPNAYAAETSLADSLHGAAKEAYSSAKLLFNNADYAGALTKYGLAYDLAKDPRLLYNMGLCEKNMRHYARMQSLFLRYERESGSKLSAERKAAVDEALAAIRNLVSGVHVTANLEGATVSVDGESVGTTPLGDPITLDLGKHTIVVSKAGFEPVTHVLEIAGSDEQSVAATLVVQQHVGHLVVAAESDTTIAIDDTPMATGRFDKSLPAGTHEVRVTSPGKIPFRSEVEIHDGETRTLEVSLSSEAHGSPPLWPWIAGGVALAAGAAIGGYFLFKPADRTDPVPPGPGDNHVQFMFFGSR